MNTYWDLTDRQRGKLSRKEVEGYAKYELMEKGVVRMPLELLDEPEMPEPDCVGYSTKAEYSRHGVVFETAEDAVVSMTKVIGFVSSVSFGQWPHAVSINTLKPRSSTDIDSPVERVPYYSAKLMGEARMLIEKAATIRAENSARRGAHEKSITAEREALSGMYEDWVRCQNVIDLTAKIKATYDEYLGMTDDNEELARKFLFKAYGHDDVLEAMGWDVEKKEEEEEDE